MIQLGAQAFAVVLPATSIKVPGSAAVGATLRSFTLPLVTVSGGTVVETGISVSFSLPAPTVSAGVVQGVNSIDLAAVASQVTIIIGDEEEESQIIWIDEVW